MKRNSKRFLALFLSLAMTITPYTMAQAEDEAANVTITAVPVQEMEAETEEDNIQESEDGTQEAPEEAEDSLLPEVTAAPEASPVPSITAEPTPVGVAEIEKEEISDSADGKTEDTDLSDVKPDGSDIVIDKPDGSGALGMFKIESSSARLMGDKIQVTIVTSTDKYDALYLGSIEDAQSDPENVCLGTENGAGYTFILEVPASTDDQTFQVAIRKKEGSVWYQYSQGGEFTITIPGMSAENPVPTETPTPTAAPTPTATPAPTPAEGTCENGIYNVDVTSSSTMFRVVNCVLTSKNGKMTAVLTLSGTGYDYLYSGTAEEAAKADPSTYVPYVVDSEGKYTYEVPVESLDKGIAVAAFSHKNQIWYDRILTFQSGTLNKIGEVPADPTPAPGICASGIYNVTVDSSATMFRVVNCVLTSKNGKMTAVLTLSGTGYDYLYCGTAAEAATADPSAYVPYVADSEGKYTYEIPVESLDQGIAVAAFSHKNQIWYDRILTFRSETLNKIGDVQDDQQNPPVAPTPTAKPTQKPDKTPTPTPTPKPDKKPDQESKYESDLNGGTSAVNSSTTLKDGTYTPDSFSFSGGTGKVNISCSKITVTNGQAYATLVFSSEYYTYVKANGNTYYSSCGGGTSTVTIPVALNQNNSIIGMTTRMSQPHEITYTIYVALKAANDSKKTDKENPADDNSMISTGNKKLDDTAPEITGLDYKDETKLEHAKYFKLYHYDKGITLLEVDMTADTARKAETAVTATTDSSTFEASSEAEKSANEVSGNEKLYLGNVVKYLIVPDGAVIPAGLDKDVIVINQPAENAYVGSAVTAASLDSLGLTDKISSVGFEKEDCTVDSLSEKMEDEAVTFAGAYDDMDYKALIKTQCGVAFLPAEILPSQESENDSKLQLLKDTAEKFATLKIPFIVDRSSDEKDDAAKEEWAKAFNAIFGTEEAQN